MFSAVRSLLFVISILLSSLAHANQSCRVVFKNINKQKTLQQRFNEFPELGFYIDRLFHDVETPLATKKMIRWFLENPNIQIKSAEEYFNINSDAPFIDSLAFKTTYFQNFKLTEANYFDSLPVNTNLKNKLKNIKLNTQPTPAIIYLRTSGFPLQQSFAYFIHELAHVKFETFLDKNIYRYIGRLPNNFIKIKKGEIYLKEDVFKYLTERFAYQTEFEISQVTFGENYLGLNKDFSRYKEDINQLVLEYLQQQDMDHPFQIQELTNASFHNIFIAYRRKTIK